MTRLSAIKISVIAALMAIFFAVPANADQGQGKTNYWTEPMQGSWLMSGAGGNDFILGLDVGSDREKVNFYKAFSKVDVGAYVQYTVDMMDWTNSYFDFNGFQVGMNMRFKLLDKAKWDMALNVDPGFTMYWANYGHSWIYDDYDWNLLGLNVNLRLVAGIKIVDRFRVHAGLVIPFEILFAETGDVESDSLPWVSMPILLNGGVEFKILPWLSVMLDLRFGPGFKFGDNVDANRGKADEDLDVGAWFEWQTQAGVAFRF